MGNIEYANAYSEVLEIIKYIPKEDYDKIPESKIKLFQTKSNPNHQLEYNPELTLEEQQVSKRAKAIIAILFRDYWATDEQREKIIRKQRNDLYKLEQEKYEKYSTDNIFNNQKNENKSIVVDKNNLPIKNESLFNKIIGFLKRLFKIQS